MYTSIVTIYKFVVIFMYLTRNCTVYVNKIYVPFCSAIISTVNHACFKDIDHCPIEIIKGLTDKGQFQYLTKLTGPQEGTYLYTTQFHSLR